MQKTSSGMLAIVTIRYINGIIIYYLFSRFNFSVFADVAVIFISRYINYRNFIDSGLGKIVNLSIRGLKDFFH